MDVRWGARRSAAQRSGTGRQRAAKVWAAAHRPAEEGVLSVLFMRGGVNVGTETPIPLIVEAFRGGGGAGRWGGSTATARTYRFSRQEIDGIGGAYSLFSWRLHLFNFFLSVTCLICKRPF